MKGLPLFSALVAVMGGSCVAARAGPLYRFVDLEPPMAAGSWITTASGEQAVGSGYLGAPSWHALLWPSNAPYAVDLNPAGFFRSDALGTDGLQQVGQGIPTGQTNDQALLWHSSAGSVIRLAPTGFLESEARGVSGNQQVGSGIRTGAVAAHTLLWNGTPGQVTDLNPTGFADSHATGTASGQQVGYGMPNGLTTVSHALLWTGTAGSFVDLHPDGFQSSEANATDGIGQVGFGVLPDGASHALLWQSSAHAFVDLNPSADVNSVARAVRGDVIVGDTSNRYFVSHAMAWVYGIPVDLSQFVPSNYDLSAANGIDAQGNIYGWVEDEWVNHTAHAAEWVPVPEPASTAAVVGACLLLCRRRKFR